MLETIQIEGLNPKEKEFVGRDGKPYKTTLVGVYDGVRWVNVYDSKGVYKTWNKGDQITLDISPATGTNGKIYYNGKIPKLEDTLAEDVKKLKTWMNKVIALLDTAFPEWRKEKENVPVDLDEVIKEMDELAKKQEEAV